MLNQWYISIIIIIMLQGKLVLISTKRVILGFAAQTAETDLVCVEA